MTSREQQAADLYGHGFGLKEVAVMLGMNHMRVRRAAVDHGVEIRQHGGAKAEEIPLHVQIAPQARELYRIYRSKSKVAAELHVGDTTVARALAVAQVQMEPAGQPAGHRTIPLREIRVCGLLRKEGKTYAQIMQATGLSETQVRNRIRWYDIEYSNVNDLAHT